MATPDDDLNELAITISMAIEKARQLKLSTSAYILSMALAEVFETTKGGQEGLTRDFTQ
jgi:hypothetical protein